MAKAIKALPSSRSLISRNGIFFFSKWYTGTVLCPAQCSVFKYGRISIIICWGTGQDPTFLT